MEPHQNLTIGGGSMAELILLKNHLFVLGQTHADDMAL